MAGYVVYRKLRDANPPEEFAAWGFPDGDATSYVDTAVEPDNAYAYRLVAVKSALELSEPSAAVEVDTPPDSPLSGFTLVDASNQTVLATLTNGAGVGLDDPDGGSFGIRADVDRTASIGSIRLELSCAKTVSRTEHIAPYSLCGDGGVNALHGASLPVGNYTLTATAYAERSLGGDELGTLQVSFTIAAN